MVSRLVPRNQSGKQSGDCFPDTFQEVSGKLSRQLPKQVSRILLQDVPNRSRTSKTPIPGNRVFWRVLGPWGRLEGSIPYSIYISQFQTGTPKPRYIGFRAGGRENGTRNGQFRPVFGHILRPLPEPHFFTLFTLWSVSGAGSWETAPGRLQDVFRKGVWEGCLEQLPRSCSRLLQTATQSGGSLVAGWGDFGKTCQSHPNLPPRLVPWFGVCHQPDHTWRKSVLPSWQVCASHPNLVSRLGWVAQTCQEVKQGVEVRWGKVVRLGCQGEVSS
jgi:hypothetical protein